MPREIVQLECRPGDSTNDFVAQIMEAMKGMQLDKFSARPLPQDPTILTYETEPRLQDKAELWENTCPVCRPIVRDLKVFCLPQEATFEEQNVFIKWEVIFSNLASALTPVETLDAGLNINSKDADENHRKDTDQGEQLAGDEGLKMHQAKPISDLGKNNYSDNRNNVGNDDAESDFCHFCAYFACMVFDDPLYEFGLSSDGIDEFEMGCCCMEAMAESERTKKVAKKLVGYAEKFGQDAGISFLIQPIDYSVESQSFGKIRFQAYKMSHSMSQQDLLDILGFRRELVLEVYGIPGESHYGVEVSRPSRSRLNNL
jgi:hypothetical protein